jgi:hypothetical protein
MKISTILGNVEHLKPSDVSDTPEGFKERYEERNRAKEIAKQLDLNPRKQIDKHLEATKNFRDLEGVTIVGRK